MVVRPASQGCRANESWDSAVVVEYYGCQQPYFDMWNEIDLLGFPAQLTGGEDYCFYTGSFFFFFFFILFITSSTQTVRSFALIFYTYVSWVNRMKIA
jgi:hypothetical protein